jgi:hypothetical protein
MAIWPVASCIWSNPGRGAGIEEVIILSDKSPLRSTNSLNPPHVSDKSTIGASEAPAVIAADKTDVEQTTAPIDWQQSRGNECYRSKRYRGFCQGPRRVPKPHGPEAELAKELGLGEIKTAWRLLSDAPDPRWVEAAGARGATRELSWPLPEGKLLRGFGKVGSRKNSHFHKGVDIGADESAPFYAVSEGIVAYADNEVRGYGNLLVVVHPDGSAAFYGHARALYLFAGQRVKRGQILGEIGHTGFALCSHLHFEYRLKGRPINPLNRFPTRTSSRE